MTRYDVLLWGYPPHKTEKMMPEVIRLLDQVSDQPLIWNLGDDPADLALASPGQWAALAEQCRERSSYGTVDLFLDSPKGLSLSLNLNAPAFVRDFDVLSIGCEIEHLLGETAMFSYDRLYALFAELISLFQPFWARITDAELITAGGIAKVHLSVDVTKVPGTVHWYNYFDDEMVERLGGRKKLQSVPAYQVKKCENPPGMILILQREPFDYLNPEHRQRHEEIARYLELDRLHALYLKHREVHLEDGSLSES